MKKQVKKKKPPEIKTTGTVNLGAALASIGKIKPTKPKGEKGEVGKKK